MFVYLLVALAAVSSAVDLMHTDCGSTAVVTRVFSDDCDSKVCKLKKGNSYQIQISYKPKSDVKTMSAYLYGVIAGIPVPFPLPQPDGCAASGGVCPIAAGTEVTFSEALKVQQAYPSMKLISRWKLHSDQEQVICVNIPVIIVS